MPYQIKLAMPPAGHVTKAARAEDEHVEVQMLEFTSSEDGQHFIKRLEGFPAELLEKIADKKCIWPSQVDHLLAIFQKDGAATVYVNELPLMYRALAARAMEAGTLVTKDDIADITHLEVGVKIPDDAGLLFLFSVGWRKGLYYDFRPVAGACSKRDFDCSAVFGQAYCHVLFQERFSISDSEWDSLFGRKWFPFCGLRNRTIEQLLNYVRAGWDPDELTDEIAAELKERLPNMLDGWRKHRTFESHISVFERAVERFQQDDPLSCAALVYPRIEGILRTHHRNTCPGKGHSPDNLSKAAVASKAGNQKCLLLPLKFETFLRRIYFADFTPGTDKGVDVSRHSVAHGEADVAKLNKKASVLGLLVVHQLYHCFGNSETPPEAQSSEDAA